MPFRYDLRPLFLSDPGEHAPIYDSEFPVVATMRGTRKTKFRLIIPKVFGNEASFQEGLARLVVIAAQRPFAKPQPIGKILRILRKKTIVVSPRTLEDFVELRYRRWCAKLTLADTPRVLRNWFNLVDRRAVYVHPRIPRGVVLVPPEHPADLGVIVHGSYAAPYPVGAGLTKKGVVGYRLQPPRAEGYD